MKVYEILETGEVLAKDRPEPTLKPGYALMRVRAVGICGTDAAIYLRRRPQQEYPRVPGHEVSGEIVKLGEGVENLRVGDRVCADPTIGCGECYPCRKGRPNCCVRLVCMGVHCDGAFTELLAWPASNLCPLPETASLESGAMAEPFSIGAQANARGEVSAGDTVAVFGCGPIGLTCLAVAKAHGARTIGLDVQADRLSFSRLMGADAVGDLSQQSATDIINEWTNGVGANVVIDASGKPEALQMAVEVVSAGGRIVNLGMSEQKIQVSPWQLFRFELDIRGSRLSQRRFPEVMALFAKGEFEPSNMITHRFPLSSAGEALEFVANKPAGLVKAVLLSD